MRKITTLFAVLLYVGSGQAQWSLTGNAKTNPATNFIGTTDAKPLIFKTNGSFSGKIDPNSDTRNNSFGLQSMLVTGAGAFNNAFGAFALSRNTNGSYNVAVGDGALSGNIAGNYNTAIGALAQQYSQYNVDNTSIGYASLSNNNGGSDNTAVGYNSLFSVSGAGNTAIGASALRQGGISAFNTAIGFAAHFSDPDSSYTNSIMIGAGASVSASYQVRIGNADITSIGGVVGWTTVSDGRFKSNIQSNVPGLDFIKQLNPVTYTLNIAELNKFLSPNGIGLPPSNGAGKKIVRTGFIAQEVAAAAQKSGFDFDGIDKPKNDKDIYGLRYEEFVTPLVKAVQELSNQNDSLKNVVTNIQSQFNDKINDILQQLKDLKNGNVVGVNGVIPSLKQNSPNPFNSNTTIGYFIPATAKNAQLIVTTAKGQLIKNIPVTTYGNGQVTIQAGELAAGNYFYTLTVDGLRVDAKQMILTR